MNVDEAAGMMDLDLTLSLYWVDKGVKIVNMDKDMVTINPDQDKLQSQIWLPDICIAEVQYLSNTSNHDQGCIKLLVSAGEKCEDRQSVPRVHLAPPSQQDQPYQVRIFHQRYKRVPSF